MLYAVKGNKQLKIDEKEKQTYLNMGYDIAEAKGDKLETIAVAPNKTVSYAEYKKLLDENAALKEQLADVLAEKAFDPIVENADKQETEKKKK